MSAGKLTAKQRRVLASYAACEFADVLLRDLTESEIHLLNDGFLSVVMHRLRITDAGRAALAKGGAK